MLEFLKLQPEAFGLDISDLSLKIVYLKRKGKVLTLASFGYADIKPGIIKEGVIYDEDALADIIKMACQNVKGKKLNTSYVIASLPEEKSFLQVIKMPVMNEKELQSAIRFEAENYIPLPINEVYLDFQTITPAKDNHGHMDVLIVATPKKIVNTYVSCLRKANLIPLAIEIESEAIVRALIKNEIQIKPMGIIDFGKTSTDFIIFSDRSIRFTSSIPASSSQLTNAIANTLNITIKKAERLKTMHGVSLEQHQNDSQKVFQAVEPILENLIMQVKKYIIFYQEHGLEEHSTSGDKIGNILLCGGGANLKGLSEYLSKKLEIPVILGDFGSNIVLKNHHPQAYQEALSYTTALGLALRGAKKP